MPPPEPTTSPSVDLEAIRERTAAGNQPRLWEIRALLAEVARLQAQVASMREVVEAARDCHDENRITPMLCAALSRLDATPQPQGDGQTRDEAGR